MTSTYSACIVFKPITATGGLERYVAELAAFLDAPIYTPVQTTPLPCPSTGTQPTVVEFREHSRIRSALERLPMGALLDAIEFERFAVPEDPDLVITVGEQAKATIHHPQQRRIHLLNMPPRWLFDRASESSDESGSLSLLKHAYRSVVRVHDLTTVSRIDEFVVPSETIARRLGTYYDRRADQVIYPPVETESYRHKSSEGYLLYLGRLSQMKRVGEIVDSISGSQHTLKVAGTGPQEDHLRNVAGPNVEILGYVSEQRKRELLAQCDALVFNSDREAFGIVPIEAMASGKPVVGVDEGYTKHQIVDGQNGILFDRGGSELLAAVQRVYECEWDHRRIQECAKEYDISRFRENWNGFLAGGD